MRFVKTEDLAKGMRLAKPIYNKNGVLLYDRDTKLTKQGINSIKNFNIIGIYILEPAEPLPPMTEEDIEFERFQTMSMFGLKEDLDMILSDKKPVNIENLIKMIIKNYCRRGKKVNFMQNIRSTEDYVYKHSINVAIMSAMMAYRLKVSTINTRALIYSALIHDIGKLMSTASQQPESEEDESEINTKIEQRGVNFLLNSDFIVDEVKTILLEKVRNSSKPSLEAGRDEVSLSTKILQIAELYDDVTSMKLDEEPISDVVAVRTLLNNRDKYDSKVVGALVDSIKMLYPGVCVELTNGYTGLVIKVNKDDVLRPMVLCFVDNKLYNLGDNDVFKIVQIRDIMKTMDKRVKIDKATIDEYMKKYT